VAAGLAFGAFGTDTGGSVRLPAAYSGVVGYKPTYGLLSLDGVIPLAPTLDHAGPLARGVFDVAALSAAVLGRSLDTELDREVRGVRVAVPRDFWDGCDPEVGRLVDAGLEALAKAGAVVEDVKLGVSVLEVMAVGYLITLAEAASYHLPELRSGREGYGHEFGLVLRAGLLLPAYSYVDALNAKSRICRRVDELLEHHDVLAMPTVGAVADPIPPGPRPLSRRISEKPVPQYTWLANLHGGPAVSVPCGLTAAGLPAGTQVMGRRDDDATVLRAARLCEAVGAWRGAHPPFWP
jgi:aspartyl-tRNA(Asn)/glutamyl-tRNA(Gln) amidotransferase subunit A